MRKAILQLPVLLLLMAFSAARAEPPATQPADSPQEKALREQLLKWDTDAPKMSLEAFRKTFHTENEREAVYTDWLAHEGWECNKTEQLIRDKWGPEADAKFAAFVGFSTLEQDRVCQIKVDGNHATVSWDIKDMKPEQFVKIDGQWYSDVHAMFDDWLKENPTMETDRRSTGKIMRTAREDIDSGKFDDVDSFLADFKTKWENPDGN